MELVEIFSALGAPARLIARIMFLPPYIINNFESLRKWPRNSYATARFGRSFSWRLWLLFDCQELEELEMLINNGSDDDVLKLRGIYLESFRLVALVGALLASVALQALNLPCITSSSYVVRIHFLTSFMLSILATFFTCVQQRTFGKIHAAAGIRKWLSNGERYKNIDGELVHQSSLAARNLLDMPYELLTISIMNLLGGVAAYLGSAFMYEVRLSVGGRSGDLKVLLVFAVLTGFAFSLFPVLLGCKAKESKAGEKNDVNLEDRQNSVEDGRAARGSVSEASQTRSRTSSYCEC